MKITEEKLEGVSERVNQCGSCSQHELVDSLQSQLEQVTKENKQLLADARKFNKQRNEAKEKLEELEGEVERLWKAEKTHRAVHERHVKNRETLTAQLEEAEKVIEFYGDWDTWEKFDLNLPFQCVKDNDLENDHGGKTAREYLKKWRN